jgi:alkanesulfonate monooxygenase
VPIKFVGSLVNPGQASCPPASELRRGAEPADPDRPTQLAALHEQAGFDWLLLDGSAASPDALIIANQVLTTTSGLGVLLATQPGLVAPTVAARQYATLNAFHPGRVAMYLTTGGDDASRLGDGDGAGDAARYRRAEEFLQVVERTWRSAEPFDYAGEFYRVAGATSSVRPPGGVLPVYLGEAPAEPLAGQHADVVMFSDQPPAAVAERIAELRTAASRYCRWPKFGLTVRRNSIGGGYRQIAQALLDYIEAGVSTLLIGGCDTEADAADWSIIIGLVREQCQGRRCLAI